MELNKEQLIEMIKMQEQLDKYIMEKQGVVFNDDLVEKIQVSLFVELGEMVNELPKEFKYWKPNAVNDREKALEEFIDCLHFGMSLHYYHKRENSFVVDEPISLNFSLFNITTSIFLNGEDLLSRLLILGNYLGFEWKEIYNAYIIKNQINYERQVSNESYINKDRELGVSDDK